MRLRSALALAFRRLSRQPVRSVLLLQGTIWGVAVAIMPSAVIEGTRAAARVEGSVLGADRISVASDPTAVQASDLVRADVAVIEEAIADAGITVRASGGVRVAHAAPAVDGAPPVTVLQATAGAESARGLALATGRWLRADEAPTACVVEARVGEALGRPGLAPGDRVRVPGWSTALEVVGVAAPRGPAALRTNDMGFDLEHTMYKQLARALLLALGLPVVQDAWKRSDACVFVRDPGAPASAPLDWLFVRVDAPRVSEAATAVRDAFAARDKAVVTLYPLVLPLVMGEEINRFDALNLALFLSCLVMGAVVMMNLGLLNVLTRRREIAVRRTEGATRPDIARQFIGEGLFLSIAGSALGCVLGMGLAQLRVSLEPVTGFTWSFPLGQAAVAVGVAIVIGVLASVLPALRASRLDPVEGLADE
jgi:putative ABC transport system permease protein